MFHHDDAVLSDRIKVAIALREFVLAGTRPDALPVNKLRNFYRKYPDAEVHLSQIRTFCETFPWLLAFEVNSAAGCIRGIPVADGAKKLMSLEILASKAAPACWSDFSSSGENTAAKALHAMLMASGGMMDAGPALSKFYRTHRELQGYIGKPAQFCSRYSNLLRYCDGDKLMALEDKAPAAVSPRSTNSVETARLLNAFARGYGEIPRYPAVVGSFLRKHPECTEALTVGLHNFCLAHPEFVRLEDNVLVAMPAGLPLATLTPNTWEIPIHGEAELTSPRCTSIRAGALSASQCCCGGFFRFMALLQGLAHPPGRG